MPKLVYFSSVSENTHRFVQRLGLPADRIPLRRTEEPLVADEEYVLVVPTYGFGKGTGAVPKQVIAFLNDEHNRSLCRGVIAAGNTNFGEAYCIAGDIISAKLQVPYLYRFELLGTRGLAPLVLEAGDSAGAAIREWSHVRLFSPWQYDVDAAARRLLTPTGWEAPPPTRLPTGADLVSDYLEPLAGTAALRDRIVTGARVTAVSRAGMDKTHGAGRADRPFLVRSVIGGEVVDHVARAVVDASGTWRHRNPLGVAGLPAPGEDEAVPYLLGPLPDVLGVNRGRVAGRHVLVVGSGHSAANTLLSLVELARTAPGTRVTWAVRGASVTRAYGGGDADGLPARGMLGARLRSAVEAGEVELLTGATITRIARHDDGLTVTLTGERELHVHAIAGATGFRPDLDLLRELRLELDPALEAPRLLAPLIDPEHHSCGTVPAHGADTLAHPAEPGFFVVGAKSYGRAPTFLLATGYEQVRSVAAHLAGDDDAARDLRLNLPETGVCSSAPPLADEEGHAVVDPAGGCCGPSDEPELIGVPTGLRHGRAGGELRA